MKESAADLSQTIRDKEKCLIFCQVPAALIFLYFIFHLLGIRVETINATQTAEERQQIIDEFNRKDSELMILIMVYAVASVGLDLQHDCWRIHAFEIAVDLGTLEQAIGRVARLGNPSTVVYLYEYVTKGTFDDKAVKRNIDKAIPQAMAELNRSIFHGDKEEATKTVEIGNWVSHQGKIYLYEEALTLFGGPLQIMTPKELIIAIMEGAKGERVTGGGKSSIACCKRLH